MVTGASDSAETAGLSVIKGRVLKIELLLVDRPVCPVPLSS